MWGILVSTTTFHSSRAYSSLALQSVQLPLLISPPTSSCRPISTGEHKETCIRKFPHLAHPTLLTSSPPRYHCGGGVQHVRWGGRGNTARSLENMCTHRRDEEKWQGSRCEDERNPRRLLQQKLPDPRARPALSAFQLETSSVSLTLSRRIVSKGTVKSHTYMLLLLLLLLLVS